jgi:streptogramin lyase
MSILFAAPLAHAQTAANFSYVQTKLGGSIRFSSLRGVATDASNNVYVADYGSGKVYEILAAGGYTTVNTLGAGSFANPTDVVVDGSGNVFVSDGSGTKPNVYKIPAGGGSVQTLGGGFAFHSPDGVALDGNGNLFVGDQSSKLYEIPAPNYNTVTQIASGTTFASTAGVAVDGSKNVYVADQGSGKVYQVVAPGYTTVNRLASSFSFSAPSAVALDANNNLYVADQNLGEVFEILAPSYTDVVTLGYSVTNAFGVALDMSGDIYVTNYNSNTLVQLKEADFGSTAVGTPSAPMPLTFTFTTGGTIGTPAVLTQGVAGLDFADAGTGTCTTTGTSHTYNVGDTCTVDVTFTPKFAGLRYGAASLQNGSGATIATGYVHGVGSGPQVSFLPGSQSTLGSDFNHPTGLAVDGSGNVFVADEFDNQIKEILATGGYVTVNRLGSGSYFNLPFGVALDAGGNVFVADSYNNEVREILAAGGYTTVNTLGSGFNDPYAVAVDGSGNVFVADKGNNAVKEILAAGGYTTVNTLGSGFSSPVGVAVDGSGNVFVADLNNNAVKEILAAGGYTTVNTLGSGFSSPYGVAVDGSGNVFVGDFGHNAVKEILAAGGYTTVNTLGTGFNGPVGVAVDGSGNVFVANYSNNTVVKLDYADAPSFSFASTNEGSTSSDSPQTVTVQNIGNAALSFPVPNSGTNASIANNFTLGGSTTCPEVSSSGSAGTLAASSSCVYAINFLPQASGSIGGSLVLTDNALNVANATQTINLSGTGVSVGDTTSTTVQTSASTVLAQSSVTLTATVSGASVPAGSVSFMDGTTQLGTATLSNTGTATLTISTLSVGSHSITAVYAGSVDFAGSTSSAITETVQDFNFTATGGNTTATVLSTTVQPGNTAIYTVQFAPTGGSTFPSAVALTLTGLPAGATYTISPSTIPAGSGTTTVTVTVNTTKQQTTASSSSPKGDIGFPKPLALAMFLPLLGTRKLRRALRAQMKTSTLMLVLLGLLTVTGMTACGGGSGFFSQAPQTHLMTLTGTSGALHHSVTLNLTIQ